MNKASETYIKNHTKMHKSYITSCKNVIKVKNAEIEKTKIKIDSLKVLYDFLKTNNSKINICTSSQLYNDYLENLSLSLPESTQCLWEFIENNSMNIGDQDDFFFYSESKLPNYEYTKDVIFLYESTAAAYYASYENAPIPLMYNGIYLIEYTTIKGPDNKEYKVFLMKKNKIVMQPVLSGYFIYPDNNNMNRVRNSTTKFIKKVLPSYSEKKLLDESNDIINFFKTYKEEGIIIYNFDSSLYESAVIDSELRKKVKLFILQIQNFDTRSTKYYFLNRNSLPICNALF